MRTNNWRRLGGLLAAAALVAGMQNAGAQQNYPNRTIRIVSAQTPGGPSDAFIRNVAEILGKSLNQAVVVEAKPGAGGMIAGEACAHAAPDGYTLCFVDSFATMLNPYFYDNMKYDPVKDFAPVTLLAFIPSGIWVNKDVPANSMKELFDLARNKPGQLNMASWGRATSPYIYVEYLKSKGIVFTDVPYKTSTDAWKGVMAGEAQLTNYSIKGGMHTSGGRARLLAVNTDQRMPELPDTPTFAEAGLPVVQTWFALLAPRGTPPEIVNRVADITRHAYQNPEFVERSLKTLGFIAPAPVAAPPDEFARFIQSQTKMYSVYVEAAQIKKQ